MENLKKESDKSSIEKVDWLYERKGHDAEEYLMGKRFEDLKDEEEDLINKDVPGFDDAIAKRTESDMKLKMREDPLYAIKLKEEEARRRILDNPFKLKKLNKLKEKQQRKAEKKKSKKTHKEKSHKKHKKQNKSDDDESEKETNELLKKYMALKKSREGKELGGQKDDSSEDEDRKKQYGLNIKRKYPMSYQHNKVDYSKLDFKKAKPSTSKKNRKILTEEEKNERREKMLVN